MADKMISTKKIERGWNELLDWFSQNEITDAVVAFSGGKDSTLVLDAALQTRGEVKAVIIDAEIYPRREVKEAEQKAEEMDAETEVIKVSRLDDDEFSSNKEDRCYHCKKRLFQEIKDRLGQDITILEGTNASEVEGHRPGLKAVKEHARAPLLETGLKEKDVRAILNWRGHDIWDKPSFACLATRFPYGRELTQEGLARVERLEEKLFSLGLKQLRVRDLGDTARIEVLPEDMYKILENREKVNKWLKDEDYENLFLDLEGYRTGSLSGRG